MDRASLVSLLSGFRRPGSPNHGRHFLHLPAGVAAPENLPLLLDILWDDALPPLVREHAAGALGEIGDPRAVEPLMDALSEKAVQRGVATALGRLKVQEAFAPLQELAARVGAARWALTQLRGSDDPTEVINDLSSGHLRYIRPRLEQLDEARRREVAAEVCRRLGLVVRRGAMDASHCWMITALQYLPASRDIEGVLTDAIHQVVGPEGRAVRPRLLRTLGAIRPPRAIPALIDLIAGLDHPGNQQVAVACVEKIVEEHGEEALVPVSRGSGILRQVLEDLRSQRATTEALEPEKPWHHPPGSPGWFAEVDRAIMALERLLRKGCG